MAGPWKQKAGKGEGNFPKAPPGNHPAVLVAMVDLGTQKSEYKGVVKYLRRSMFVWELTAEPIEGGKDNHLIGIDLTISLNENAKLRQWIESRLGKKMPDDFDYDIDKELGKPCLLNVAEHKGYPKVEGMSPVPKGMTVPPPKRKPFLFSLEDLPENPANLVLPDWLPWLYGRRLADVILECGEVSGQVAAGKPVGGGDQGYVGEETPTNDDGDIPF